ncbi:potassium channel family protein [Gemmatimonadota bacterium]
MARSKKTRAVRKIKLSGRMAEFHRIQKRLELAILALILVTVIGVTGFMLIGKGEYKLVDATYMTVITLTTVGFSEVIDMSANPAGRVFTMFLLLGGMGIAAYTMLTLASFVIEGQLRHIFTRRQMQRRIGRMKDHFIVCGDTFAMWYVTEELTKTGRSVVLVASSQESIDEATERLGDIPVVVGEPSDDDVLIEAGVIEATGIVFSMADEKDNLLGVLTARRLSPGLRIIASTERPETIAKLRSAGADAIVSPTHIGGMRMASELIRPTVVSFLDQMLRVGGGSLRVEEVKIGKDSPFIGQTLLSLFSKEINGILLLAVHTPGREDSDFKPPMSTVLESGMRLIIMTDVEGREKLEERIQAS